MASFPQGPGNVDQRCNPGERRVLHQLKRCLGDDYLVWHDVPLGPRARQPDFVILSPRRGVLLLEVKGWRRSTLVSATRDAVELDTPRGRTTVAHPLRQARDVTLELVDLMQRDPALVHAAGPFTGKLVFPYGWGVVLSSLRRDEVAGSDFDELFPAARTLLRDDLDESVDPEHFQQRLWGMFTIHYPHTLSLPQRDRIRWHLFPELRLPVQASLLADGGDDIDTDTAAGAASDMLRVMDLQQEQIARSLGDGHRVIHGAAGSGKTLILIFRARQLAAGASAERPILVLCYNRALAARIDMLLRSSNSNRSADERVVVVRTFHGWCEELVRAYQLNVPVDRRAADYWEQLAATVARAVETGFVPGGQYTALLVDEAHDFEDAWLRLAASMVNPATRSLLVLYDDVQSIYQKKRKRFNFASVGIEAVGRTSILRMNYRNTAAVLALALECAQGLLGDAHAGEPDPREGWERVQPSSAGRPGPLPVLIEGRSEFEEAELVTQRIVAALAGGRNAGDIAVVTRARYQMAAFERALRQAGVAYASMAAGRLGAADWAAPSVKLLTLHSSKGLEFPFVVVAGLQAMPRPGEPMDEELRLLYVGMTRATDELMLSAHGRSAVVDKVRKSVEAVASRFQRAA